MAHLSDLDVANQSTLQPVKDIATSVGISEDALEPYDHCKTKIDINKITPRENKGKVVLVIAVSPTPADEGKSAVTVGLADAFHELNKNVVVALREPALRPASGIRDDVTGGSYVQALLMEDINLHFDGDFRAITTTNSVLSAFIGNHIHQGNELGIDQKCIEWRRVLNMNDRTLRHVNVGLGGPTNGVPHEDGFNITVVSGIMAILHLSRSIEDLKDKISRITIDYTKDRKPVTIVGLEVEGALAMILKDAIKPSLVQLIEGTPALVHGGLFTNVVHDYNSVLAAETTRGLADIVVTEAGFGSDLDAKEFVDIKVHEAGFDPTIVVVVTTIRTLKVHDDATKDNLKGENVEAVRVGIINLECHVNSIKKFGIGPVVAVNAFIYNTGTEVEYVKPWAKENNVRIALTEVWKKGGKGGVDLASEVLEVIDQPNSLKPLYELGLPLRQRIKKVATEIYSGLKITFSSKTQKQLKQFKENGQDDYPVCMTKTQYSFSDDQALLGTPPGFEITIRELEAKTDAGFVVALTDAIMTMPGLPKKPAALDMDVTDDGHTIELF